MEMTEWLTRWMSLLVLAAQGLMTWIIWSLKREFVRLDDCAKHKGELAACHAALAARVSNTEADIGNMPSSAAWTKMQVAIEEVRGTNKTVLAKLEGQNEVLKRIEYPMQLLMEHHLKGDK